MLGMKVKDKITGFAGTVTGRCEYITGCNQVLVAPPLGADGSFKEPMWLDEQRCDVQPGEPLVLDNGATPGFDKPAPIR